MLIMSKSRLSRHLKWAPISPGPPGEGACPSRRTVTALSTGKGYFASSWLKFKRRKQEAKNTPALSQQPFDFRCRNCQDLLLEGD